MGLHTLLGEAGLDDCNAKIPPESWKSCVRLQVSTYTKIALPARLDWLGCLLLAGLGVLK